MGKAFALLLIVLGIWIGLSVYTEGWDRAFGGVFAKLGFVEAGSHSEAGTSSAVTERVRQRVGAAYREHEGRTRRAVDQD